MSEIEGCDFGWNGLSSSQGLGFLYRAKNPRNLSCVLKINQFDRYSAVPPPGLFEMCVHASGIFGRA